MNIWQTLRNQGPIFALAPMEDVTDTVFRRIVLECGRPTIMFTEFTNCEGAQSVGQARIIHRLRYTESERPIIAQVWGITPEDYSKTTQMVKELGFDGIDINMGCPVKKIIKNGACSALIKNPTLAKEIVLAVREAAGEMPVSIKTRIGFHQIQTEEWIGFLLQECRPDALTIHGRTVKELSNVPNHWEEIAKAVTVRDSLQDDQHTVIIGNGDVMSISESRAKIDQYKVDGVMIGRGIFHNLWLFDETTNPDTQSPESRLTLLQNHVRLWDETWGTQKNFQILKRYFKIYIQGFAGASELRHQLMQAHNPEEVYAICKRWQ